MLVKIRLSFMVKLPSSENCMVSRRNTNQVEATSGLAARWKASWYPGRTSLACRRSKSELHSRHIHCLLGPSCNRRGRIPDPASTLGTCGWGEKFSFKFTPFSFLWRDNNFVTRTILKNCLWLGQNQFWQAGNLIKLGEWQIEVTSPYKSYTNKHS